MTQVARGRGWVPGLSWRSPVPAVTLWGMGAIGRSTDRAPRARQLVRPFQRLALFCLAGLCLVAAACATPGADRRSQVHVVRSGETLWAISRRYDTTVDAIARANRLRDPRVLRVGQR